MFLQQTLIIVICVYINIVSANANLPRVGGEMFHSEQHVTEDDESLLRHEKDKYQLQMAIEQFKATVDATREPTEEEIKAILDKEETVEEESPVETADSVDKNVQGVVGDYEFPKLVIVDPGNVGDEVELELQDGKLFRRITRSLRPPVFEIPDFLTPEECDHIMEAARKNGLDTSNLFGLNIHDELKEERNGSDISRISEQTWLGKPEVGDEFWNVLHTRLARLTQLDIGMIDRAEPMQVVSYVPGGHYHAHLDSVDTSDLPCCFQTRCGDKENTAEWSKCCRLCRFITVLYYLNDVEAGGETAFPLADVSDDIYEEKMTNLGDQKWYNLSHYCHNSSLVVSPKRGTAIFWYSHFIDEETGYIGRADQRSHHGGCDLLKGSKWIANNWISGTTHEDRFRTSAFYNPPTP